VIERIFVFMRWLKGYIPLILSILALLSIIRLLWFFSYGDLQLLTAVPNDIFSAFLLGLRFDLSDVCYFSVPGYMLTLFWLLLGPTRPSKKIVEFYIHFWVFWMLLLLFIAAVDFKYYTYFQDHINILIFGFFEDDTWALVKTFWHNYPLIRILITIVVGYYLLFKLLSKYFWNYERLFVTEIPNLAFNKFLKWGFRGAPFISFLLLFLGARGSLGLFPLEIMHTAISKNQFINVLAFNGPHALARAAQLKLQQSGQWNEGMKKYGYNNKPEQAVADFLGVAVNGIPKDKPLLALLRKTDRNEFLEAHPPHVVFILMESMGSDWLARHKLPSLNLLGGLEKHFKADFLFKNFMPASAATIGSLGTLLTNLPPRTMAPFLTDSEFIRIPFSTAPALHFKSKGYETRFIYGGNLGWRDLAKFVPLQGFDKLHSEVDMQELNPGAEFEKHDWGAYDEYVFQLTEKLLNEAKKPQFIFILTTTNHPPYTFPKNYSLLPLEISDSLRKQLIGEPALAEKRLQVYQYANQQLGIFMDNIKASSLRHNTIAAASGDHSFYILPYDNQELLAKWGVPFYLYLPEEYFPNKKTKADLDLQMSTYGSHIDIFPTLYHLALSDLSYTAVGHNLLIAHKDQWAIHAASQSIFNQDGLVYVHSNSNYAAFSWTDGKKPLNSELTENLAKAKKHFESLFSITDLLFENEKVNFFKK
jgi:phosphoglycerol transferase MdoB-like AlkP superfamily enzyme